MSTTWKIFITFKPRALSRAMRIERTGVPEGQEKAALAELHAELDRTHPNHKVIHAGATGVPTP